MGARILDADIETDYIKDDDFDDDNVVTKKMGIDARRRLEDRKEDLRLQRELRYYDFDN